jgi:branched-chain amino acid transport system permease protein
MNRAWLLGIVGSAVAIALTWIAPDFRLFQFATVASWAIAMLGLNLLTGFNGQISLGHGAFMGIGAYTVAILVRDQGMSYPIAMLIAFALCFVFGGLLGIPALRLPGTSLALITVALALAFPQVIKKFTSVTNGVGGISTPPSRQFRAPEWTNLSTDQFKYLFLTSISIVMFWLAWNLTRGRWGLAMMSIRDNPVAAASMGVNLPRVKVFTFALSAGYAGMGGAMAAIVTPFVGPDSFGINQSIQILTVGVIGVLLQGYAWITRRRGSKTEAAVLEQTGGFSTTVEEPIQTGTAI